MARVEISLRDRVARVHVIVAFGASDDPFAGVHVTKLTFGSVIVTLLKVTLPALVAWIVLWMT
jgi:hypothetical protein